MYGKILTSGYYAEFCYFIVRKQEILIGLALLVTSIYGYYHASQLVGVFENQMLNSMSGVLSSPSPDDQKFSVVKNGYPSAETLTKVAQYGFIAFSLISIGIIVFGVIAKKKMPSQFVANTSIEVKNKEFASTKSEEVDRANINGIRILKDRLAKGDITESEFKNLRKFFE